MPYTSGGIFHSLLDGAPIHRKEVMSRSRTIGGRTLSARTKWGKIQKKRRKKAALLRPSNPLSMTRAHANGSPGYAAQVATCPEERREDPMPPGSTIRQSRQTHGGIIPRGKRSRSTPVTTARDQNPSRREGAYQIGELVHENGPAATHTLPLAMIDAQ